MSWLIMGLESEAPVGYPNRYWSVESSLKFVIISTDSIECSRS